MFGLNELLDDSFAADPVVFDHPASDIDAVSPSPVPLPVPASATARRV
jgi:hypothetical protein